MTATDVEEYELLLRPRQLILQDEGDRLNPHVLEFSNPPPGRTPLELISHSMRLRPVPPLPKNLPAFPWPTGPSGISMTTSDFNSWCQSAHSQSIGHIEVLDVLWLETQRAPFFHQYTVLRVNLAEFRDDPPHFYYLRVDRLGILNSRTAKEAVTVSNMVTTNISHEQLARYLGAKIIVSVSIKQDGKVGPTLGDVARCIHVISDCCPQYKLQTTNCHFQARSLTLSCIIMRSPDCWQMITKMNTARRSDSKLVISNTLLQLLMTSTRTHYHRVAKFIATSVVSICVIIIIVSWLLFKAVPSHPIAPLIIAILCLSVFLYVACMVRPGSVNAHLADLTNQMWNKLSLQPIAKVRLYKLPGDGTDIWDFGYYTDNKYNHFLQRMPLVVSLSLASSKTERTGPLEQLESGISYLPDANAPEPCWYWWAHHCDIDDFSEHAVVLSIIWFIWRTTKRQLVMLVVKEPGSLERSRIVFSFEPTKRRHTSTYFYWKWITLPLPSWSWTRLHWVIGGERDVDVVQIDSQAPNGISLTRIYSILDAIYDSTSHLSTWFRQEPTALFMLTVSITQPGSWRFSKQSKSNHAITMIIFDSICKEWYKTFLQWNSLSSICSILALTFVLLQLRPNFPDDTGMALIVLAAIFLVLSLVFSALGTLYLLFVQYAFRKLVKKVWHRLDENLWNVFQGEYIGVFRGFLRFLKSYTDKAQTIYAATFELVRIQPKESNEILHPELQCDYRGSCSSHDDASLNSSVLQISYGK